MKPYKPPPTLRYLTMLAALLAGSAGADPRAPARPDPADAGAEVPPVVYRSALRGYRPYVDTEPASWVEANQRVGRIGGWRVYAREGAEAPPTASGASAPAAAPSAHDGHHRH